ncbi:MAG: hypothetical protein SFW09_22810 [Hyphomicrobiaceae bacterium]|nr:hypothetical protein [Hyphomicrobiaceae bacterium]
MTVVPAAESHLPHDAAFAIPPKHSYVDWSAILGGTAVAVAMGLVLSMFGAAVGLSLVSPWSYEGISASTAGIAAAIWFALVQIYASGLGGYLAGRMRPRAGDAVVHEVRFRDGINGLVVWALAVAVSAMLSMSILSGLARTAGSVASTAATAVGPVAERVIDTAMRAPVAPAGGDQGRSPAAAGERTGLSDQQRAELTRIVTAALAKGELSPEDRAYLEQVVARQTGVAPEVAKQRVNSAINDAITTAKSAADKARSAAAFGGFWTAVVMMLAGMAAWWGGSLGGTHRDEELLTPR